MRNFEKFGIVSLSEIVLIIEDANTELSNLASTWMIGFSDDRGQMSAVNYQIQVGGNHPNEQQDQNSNQRTFICRYLC